MIVSVMERKEATMRYSGEMQKALLYGSKIWVVNREMLKVLTALHHQAAQRITGMTAKCGADGEWDYPAVDEAMGASGIHPIGIYISRCHTTIEERVTCLPVYALCTEAEWISRTSRMVR